MGESVTAEPVAAPATPPVSGAWREGDPAGRRRFADLGTLRLETGTALPGVRMAFETWGRLSPRRDNAVLVTHALTGDSHVVGDTGPGHPSPGSGGPARRSPRHGCRR